MQRVTAVEAFIPMLCAHPLRDDEHLKGIVLALNPLQSVVMRSEEGFLRVTLV